MPKTALEGVASLLALNIIEILFGVKSFSKYFSQYMRNLPWKKLPKIPLQKKLLDKKIIGGKIRTV